jgi:predicted kinase
VIVIAFAGLPGTGKSTLARAVAARFDAVVLDKDRVREALFGGRVDYSRGQNDLAARAMYREVEALAAAGAEYVVLDGRTFSKRYQVDELRELGRRIAGEVAFVECVCASEVARERIERDVRSGAHPARNRTPDLHDKLRSESEPIAGEKLVVHTDEEAPESAVERIVAWIGERRVRGSQER